MSLRRLIEAEIREHGPIPFSRYMELCLYHPTLGYYSRNAQQFGKTGDFYTSSDVHAVFGRLLARQFEEMWRTLGSSAQIEILELGPGRGLFAQDVLDWSEKKFPAFFHALHYSLVERSPELRVRLRAVLARFLERGIASSVSETVSEDHVPQQLRPWFSDPSRGPGAVSFSNAAPLRGAAASFYDSPEQAGARTTSVAPNNAIHERALPPEVPVIVFANEFFDALPVEILGAQGVLRVSAENGRFVETWVPPSAEEMEFLDRYSAHPEPGERIEVPLLAHRYMARFAASLRTGILVAIDYGYTRGRRRTGSGAPDTPRRHRR